MVSSSEEIIRRAKQMDLEAKYGSPIGKESQADILAKYIQILENKINILMEKVDILMQSNVVPINETHDKIVNMLWDWKSTSDIAGMLGYRQEHVSRMISNMKKMNIIQERREGKKRFYKRIE